ncbi:hypothetical protein Tco_1341451 [Tanacetum coccineum]
MSQSPFVDSGFDVPVFSPRDDPIACLNKAMDFLTAVASSRFPSTNNQLRTSSNPRNQATIQDGKVTVQQVQGRQGQNYFDPGISASKAQIVIPHNAAFQTEDLDTYDSDFFKNESKEKENKYIENEIDLEKKIKELDNIICKVGQSAQTVHMLTKPQAFYDNTHKQALGYQNPYYLKKAQRIKPTWYDGVVMSNAHVVMYVIDDEETLILEEESQ